MEMQGVATSAVSDIQLNDWFGVAGVGVGRDAATDSAVAEVAMFVETLSTGVKKVKTMQSLDNTLCSFERLTHCSFRPFPTVAQSKRRCPPVLSTVHSAAS